MNNEFNIKNNKINTKNVQNILIIEKVQKQKKFRNRKSLIKLLNFGVNRYNF